MLTQRKSKSCWALILARLILKRNLRSDGTVDKGVRGPDSESSSKSHSFPPVSPVLVLGRLVLTSPVLVLGRLVLTSPVLVLGRNLRSDGTIGEGG